MPFLRPFAALAASAALLAACTQPEMPAQPEPPAPAASARTSDPNVAGAGGCWNLRHGTYSGRLILRQTGTSVVGYMNWFNHADAWVTGSVLANGANLTFNYLYEKSGLIGQYNGTFTDADQSTLTGFNGGSQWVATNVACLEESIPGCYNIEQGSYRGNLVLNSDGPNAGEVAVTGHMDWANHADAIVAGTFNHSNRKMSVRFTYPNGAAGMYDATLTSDNMYLQNGSTYPPGNPNQSTPFYGWSRTCKDAAGCFDLSVHHGNQVWSYGTARINLSGDYLVGHVDWQGIGRVTLDGTLRTRRSEFRQTKAGTLIDGTFTSILSHEGDVHWYGEHFRNGTKVGDYHALRILCPAP